MNAIKPESKTAVEPDARNIHQRLHAVMGEVSYIQKDRNVGNYKVVSHDAVTAKVRPVLVKHGVIYYPQNMVHSQNGNRTEVHLDIVFVNVADPKDIIAVPTFGYGIDQSDKGPGKAVSYAVKMALLKALGLETGEDADDGTDQAHKPDAEPAATDPTKVKNAAGVSQVKTWVREHIEFLNDCDGADAFLEAIAHARVRWVKCCAIYPNVWSGPDGSGLKGECRRIATIFQCESDYSAFVVGVETEAKSVQQAAQ